MTYTIFDGRFTIKIKDTKIVAITCQVQLIDNARSNAMHITRCAVSRSLGVSPGALVFRRDMFLDIPSIADLLEIQAKRRVIIDENLRRQNQKRI